MNKKMRLIATWFLVIIMVASVIASFLVYFIK
jgi:hypothetical protein